MYYLVHIKTINDGTQARECSAFNDVTGAISNYHARMATAMSDSNCTKCVCVVLNSNGKTIKNECFTREEEVGD